MNKDRTTSLLSFCIVAIAIAASLAGLPIYLVVPVVGALVIAYAVVQFKKNVAIRIVPYIALAILATLVPLPLPAELSVAWKLLFTVGFWTAALLLSIYIAEHKWHVQRKQDEGQPHT